MILNLLDFSSLARYDYSLFNAVEVLSNRWLTGDNLPTDKHDFDQFSTNQKVEFLANLLIKVLT